MISKNQIKHLHSLRLKKFRELNQVFVVEGIKLVDELLASDSRINEIFGTGSWLSTRRELLRSRGIPFTEITNSELGKASTMVTPNEVIAIVSMPDQTLRESGAFGKIVLILDRIQDPGNLGTILRTADWFGIRQVIASRDTADLYNPKVIQATMGSVFRVPLHYTDIGDFIREKLKGWQIFAATAHGESIYSMEVKPPVALIIGNESEGISELILSMAGRKIAIPSYSGGAESLNASVATGILCAEFTRRMNTAE